MQFEHSTRRVKYIRLVKRTYANSNFPCLVLVLCLFSVLVVWRYNLSPNFALFGVNIIQSLPIVTTDSINLYPPEKSIFFHETSGKGVLDSRQACAVESAARTHTSWHINVLFIGQILDTATINVLKSFENIKFYGLDVKEYSEGTPLEGMIRSGALNRSRWRISHTSDALRYLSLYKWGGIYLDLDVIVAKSFEGLAPNWGARESKTAVAAGAMAFSRDQLGREVAEAAIKDFMNNFRGDIWGHNGPGVMTRILKNLCKTRTISEMSASRCKGFAVYGPELFYPVTWRRAKDYFGTKKLNLGHPYTYHIWNRLTKNFKVKKNSVYAKLAEKYCPIVFDAFKNQFGK